jgi:hypothetical protein
MTSERPITSTKTPTILERSSTQSFLTPLQNQADLLVGDFTEQATDPQTLCAMVGAGAAYRLGRLASLGVGSRYLSQIPNLVRLGSLGIGLAAESATFAGLQRSFRTFEGQCPTQSFGKEWLNAAISLGSLKAFGKLAEGQNLALQHLFSDLGMVGSHHAASLAGLEAKPEGDLFSQFLHAEAMNWQMKAGMSLVHGLAPQLSAAERSMDLLSKRKEGVLGSLRPTGTGLSLSPLLAGPVGEISLEPSSERVGKTLPLQMASSSGPPSGGPPPESRLISIRDPSPAEIEWIQREFGTKLLTELFGKYQGDATRFLATLYVHRPEVRVKFPPYVFARADIEGRRLLLRDLVKASQSESTPSPRGSRTLAQVSLFSEAMNLLIYFRDHNQKELNRLQVAAVGRQVAEAAPSTSAEPRGTNPLPSNFLQPKLIVGGEKLPILTNFRGHYELGRSHFFGDTAVSLRHFLLNFHMGIWYLVDAQSTYGTYYYDAKRKSWEAYSKEHWKLLNSKDLLNIGNAYYRMNILGGSIQFDPVVLPPEIEPNAIRRFTSVTFDGNSFRMELESTRHGEKGSLRVGEFLFQSEGGRHYLLHLGAEGAIQLEGNSVPTALNPQTHEIDESKRQELRHGNRLQYQGQTYQVRIGEDGSIDLLRVSYFANYIPPPSQNQTLQAFDWQAAGSPTIQDGGLKMNQSRVLLIGRMKEKDLMEPKKGSQEIWEYSVEKKPWYLSLLWFLSSPWIRVEKNPLHQRFEITNNGIKEGIFIQDGYEKNLLVPQGRTESLKPGERLVFRGRTLVIFP